MYVRTYVRTCMKACLLQGNMCAVACPSVALSCPSIAVIMFLYCIIMFLYCIIMAPYCIIMSLYCIIISLYCIIKSTFQHSLPLACVQIYSERVSGTFADVWQAAASTLYMCTGRRPNRHLYLEAEPRNGTLPRVRGSGGGKRKGVMEGMGNCGRKLREGRYLEVAQGEVVVGA